MAPNINVLCMFHADLFIEWHRLGANLGHELWWEADLKPVEYAGKPMGSRSVFVGSQFCNAYKTWEKCGKLLRPVGPIIILLLLRHPNGTQFSPREGSPGSALMSKRILEIS